ncbi:hypothetical protein ABH923_002946 [Leifsonia sp. EB41]|uniref:DUF4234 domain-containing protein n=1 Tax=Leifsonia sp. EB41 TaxID=3156260 RepID=UPI003511CA31
MKRRSPAAVFWLPLITFGIYSIVWLARTRGDLNRVGESVPTTWLYIVPIVNFWWLWRFAVGTANVSGRGAGGAFALLLLLGPIGAAIVQSWLNKRDAVVVDAGAAPAVA